MEFLSCEGVGFTGFGEDCAEGFRFRAVDSRGRHVGDKCYAAGLGIHSAL